MLEAHHYRISIEKVRRKYEVVDNEGKHLAYA